MNEVEYGWYKNYYQNGQIKVQGYYPENNRTDTLSYKYKHLYSDSSISVGEFYYIPMTGEWKYWHPNGKIAKVEQWDWGLKQGMWIYYDTLGNITKTENWIKNLLVE